MHAAHARPLGHDVRLWLLHAPLMRIARARPLGSQPARAPSPHTQLTHMCRSCSDSARRISTHPSRMRPAHVRTPHPCASPVRCPPTSCACTRSRPYACGFHFMKRPSPSSNDRVPHTGPVNHRCRSAPGHSVCHPQRPRRCRPRVRLPRRKERGPPCPEPATSRGRVQHAQARNCATRCP